MKGCGPIIYAITHFLPCGKRILMELNSFQCFNKNIKIITRQR